MVRVGIISHDRLTLLGLRNLLEGKPDIQVVLVEIRPFPLAGQLVDCLVIDLELTGEDTMSVLMEVIQRLIGGDRYDSGASSKPPEVRLSPREKEVLRLITSGYTHDQVGRRIGVSRHTVDTYVKRLRAKLNAGNKAELASAAWRLRLSDPVLG